MTIAPRLLSGAAAAEYCGVTPATWSKWVAAGTVPPALPGTRRWDRKAIDGFRAQMDVRPLLPTLSQVYFIQMGRFIKIGYAASAIVRLQTLQTSSPYTLKILGTIPGGPLEEKRIHDLFEHLRERGEWFRKTPDLLEYIAWLQTRATQ